MPLCLFDGADTILDRVTLTKTKCYLNWPNVIQTGHSLSKMAKRGFIIQSLGKLALHERALFHKTRDASRV